MIYQAVVTIQAYFSVFADIASMWSELSREDIMPGLKLVDMMSLPQNNEEQQLKMDELQNWTQKAQDHITQVAAKACTFHGSQSTTMASFLSSLHCVLHKHELMHFCFHL